MQKPLIKTEKQRAKRFKIKRIIQKVMKNITYTTENTEGNDRKYSTGINGIKNRVKNIEEIVEDKVPVEMRNSYWNSQG